MAVMYRNPRVTKASLDTLAGNSNILVGQVYLLTDQNRIAIGLTTSTYQLFEKQTPSNITFVIDGGGVPIVAGQVVELPDIPYACTILGWTLVGDVAGDSVVTVSRATYADYPTFTDISGIEKPTLSAAQKNQDLGLTTWTTTVNQGDILQATVDSASLVKRLQLSLRVMRN